MSSVEEVRTMLEEHLHGLEEQIDSLRSALAILESDGAQGVAAADAAAETADAAAETAAVATAAGAAVKNGRQGARGASRRASHRNGSAGAQGSRRHARSTELEMLLAQTGGADAVELARQTGTDPADVLARIRELEEAARGRRRAGQPS